MEVARKPQLDANEGLRMIARDMPSGHKQHSCVGRPSAWMARFGGTRNYLSRINTPGSLNVN